MRMACILYLEAPSPSCITFTSSCARLQSNCCNHNHRRRDKLFTVLSHRNYILRMMIPLLGPTRKKTDFAAVFYFFLRHANTANP